MVRSARDATDVRVSMSNDRSDRAPGPDHREIYLIIAALVVGIALGPLVLGHRRLAIFDTSEAGAQPMRLPEAGLVVSYNGELYNHPELRRELEDAGVEFRSGCDTEVLLRGYER